MLKRKMMKKIKFLLTSVCVMVITTGKVQQPHGLASAVLLIIGKI